MQSTPESAESRCVRPGVGGIWLVEIGRTLLSCHVYSGRRQRGMNHSFMMVREGGKRGKQKGRALRGLGRCEVILPSQIALR